MGAAMTLSLPLPKFCSLFPKIFVNNSDVLKIRIQLCKAALCKNTTRSQDMLGRCVSILGESCEKQEFQPDAPNATYLYLKNRRKKPYLQRFFSDS